MAIGDFLESAKDKLAGHEDQAEAALDKAGDAVKDKTPDQVDGFVDKGVDAADDYIRKE
jgi:ElaB/YqjD/DUF883 family membrane-anchored ribosome-binding protein